MNFVLDIIFLLVIFLALVREKTIIGKPSSPLNLMIVFNMGVLGLYYITAKPLGFHPLTFRTFEVLLYGLFVFAIVSLVYTSGVIKPRCCFNDIKLRYVKDYPSKGLLIFAALTILFMLYKLSNFGVENVLEDEDTAASFGGNGLNGHTNITCNALDGTKANVAKYCCPGGFILLLIYVQCQSMGYNSISDWSFSAARYNGHEN